MSESLKLEFEGTVLRKGDVQTFGDFYKKDIVIRTGGEYPQEIKVEFHKGNADKLNNVTEGGNIKVYADVRGREHNGNWYNNIVGWKVDVLSSHEVREAEPTAVKAMEMSIEDDGDDSDGLPF